MTTAWTRSACTASAASSARCSPACSPTVRCRRPMRRRTAARAAWHSLKLQAIGVARRWSIAVSMTLILLMVTKVLVGLRVGRGRGARRPRHRAARRADLLRIKHGRSCIRRRPVLCLLLRMGHASCTAATISAASWNTEILSPAWIWATSNDTLGSDHVHGWLHRGSAARRLHRPLHRRGPARRRRAAAAAPAAADAPPPGLWIDGIHFSAQLDAGIIANPFRPNTGLNFGQLFTITPTRSS